MRRPPASSTGVRPSSSHAGRAVRKTCTARSATDIARQLSYCAASRTPTRHHLHASHRSPAYLPLFPSSPIPAALIGSTSRYNRRDAALADGERAAGHRACVARCARATRLPKVVLGLERRGSPMMGYQAEAGSRRSPDRRRRADAAHRNQPAPADAVICCRAALAASRLLTDFLDASIIRRAGAGAQPRRRVRPLRSANRTGRLLPSSWTPTGPGTRPAAGASRVRRGYDWPPCVGRTPMTSRLLVHGTMADPRWLDRRWTTAAGP